MPEVVLQIWRWVAKRQNRVSMLVGWKNPVSLVGQSGNFELVAGGVSCDSQDAGVAKGICTRGAVQLSLHQRPELIVSYLLILSAQISYSSLSFEWLMRHL
jgi:hypothetical protein